MSQSDNLNQIVITFVPETDTSTEVVVSLLEEFKTVESGDVTVKYSRKCTSFFAGLVSSRYDWSYCLVFVAFAIFIIIIGRVLGSQTPYPDELGHNTVNDTISAMDHLPEAVFTSTTTKPNSWDKGQHSEKSEPAINNIVIQTYSTTSTSTHSYDDILRTEDYFNP